ncbi:MAG: DDE-type integrase/transposase/recombinase [Acidobacteria bacterium]|nr:DDE-type integrase/transposase/recombinase [Acidobacteriota bacterium]
MRRSALAKLNLDEVLKENIFLRDELTKSRELVAILRTQLDARKERRHLTIKERLAVLWHMEYFKIPKRQATKSFGIARSTLDRWLHDLAGRDSTGKEPTNKTPVEVVRLVWEIACHMPMFGKVRISQQLALLSVFVSASTVRNILGRAEPRTEKPKPSRKESSSPSGDLTAAERPNQVWSADHTTVKLWWIWPVHVFVVIDQFSRKLIAVAPSKSATTKSVLTSLQRAFQLHGRPTQLVTDQGSAFTSTQFEEFLRSHGVEHVLGAVGQHGSIARTERVHLTLKTEWFGRVTFIRSMNHLADLCTTAARWYNELRPHQGIAGNRPNDVHREGRVIPFAPDDRSQHKTVPAEFARSLLAEPRTSAWRLERCA